ncbi:hypothetical protein [Flavobacterium sp. ZB4R12]|uniref:hypothetical protein n=1 Tax=unclassified Flavobacterium TaxID=196869 RepID=UPI003AAF44A2
MQLALNIEHFAKPVVTETRISFVSNFFGILFKGIKKRLYNDIDNFILAVEGFYPYSEKLELSEAAKLLERTKLVISKLNKIDEDLYKDDYLKDQILKEKYKYMLKSIYKMESILHKTIYKNSPVEKTDKTILKGISDMNKRNMSKLLSV